MISYSQDARLKLQSGINKLSKAVSVTLGPKGRTVIIRNQHITKDGVTVARAVTVEDELEQLGIDLVKEVAIKTCDDAGDGTTSSIILANALINEGIKQLAAGHDPLEIKLGLDEACQKVVEYIKEVSTDIGNNIKTVATISANNDEYIGSLLETAINQVGMNGIVSVEESKNEKTYVDLVKGCNYDRGYVSDYFVNNTDQKTFEYENPIIVIHNGKLENLNLYEDILNNAFKSLKPILIIADNFEQQVIDALIANKLKNHLKVCAMIAPSFGDKRRVFLHDLALMLGCKNGVGSCEKVVIGKHKSTFVNGKGVVPENILDEAKSDIERYSKLTGGVSIIYVGGNSEIEMKEKKDRIDDALCATKSAIEEGIVQGGGTTYLKAKKSLSDYEFKYKVGSEILMKILETPLRKIVSNAGGSPDVVVNKVLNEDVIYNARTDKYNDGNILDPAKVSRVALENAVSVAGTILTTECVIC